MNSPYASSELTRRDILIVLGAGFAASVLRAGSAFAEDKPANKVTFGFSLYGMQTLPLGEAIPLCKRIGYDAVELVCMPGWASAPESLNTQQRSDLSKLLVDNAQQLPALMENLPLLVDDAKRQVHRDRLKAAAELGHDLSPQSPPVIETVLGGKPADWETSRNAMAEELGTWADVGKSTQTVIAIKPHVGGALHTPEGADWLFRQVNSPWIKLAYDYSHYQAQGMEMKPSLELLLPNSVFIHIKDNQGKNGQVQFALPGDGDIDYETYFSYVREQGYAGTVMVEVSAQLFRKPEYNAEAAARRCYENIAPVMKKTGLRG